MKVGTIGTGNILQMILGSIAETEGITCEAVYSRKMETGKRLAEKFDVAKVYSVYEEMLKDEVIDFIYIASPNSLHYEHAKKALEAGKNVICEKPFTTTLKETRELIALAKEKKLYLFEAVTLMYTPNYQLIREHLGEIGKIKLVQCSYCQYSSRYDALLNGEVTNVFNPAFSGGSLMDINFYNVYFIMGLFGKPSEARYYPNCIENGIDTSGIVMMSYPDFQCSCTGAKDTWGVNCAQIHGEKGYIYVTEGSNGCKEIKVVTKENETIYNEQTTHQWYYEIQGITKIVNKGAYEECYKRLDRTAEVVGFLEEIRKDAGIIFAADVD
ncbi:MAG: oxidoreductase [Herbinix sp.]|nr:oxidoreductase [Herbinix sp.]